MTTTLSSWNTRLARDPGRDKSSNQDFRWSRRGLGRAAARRSSSYQPTDAGSFLAFGTRSNAATQLQRLSYRRSSTTASSRDPPQVVQREEDSRCSAHLNERPDP
jgi:hypothetical protein